MIRINLLPYEKKKKMEDVRRQILIVSGVFIILIIFLVGIHLYMSSRVSALEAEIKINEEKLAVLNKKIGDLEKFKKDSQELQRKLDVIGKLEGNRLAPVKRMDEMTMLVPVKDMWLEKLTETGNNLRIEGVARNSMTVALFMKNLEASSFIKSVDLVFLKEREISGNKLQQFILSCGMTRGS